MFTFYKNSQKGQDLVEYALMLAIIIGIGWGIYSQTGVADSIKNVFGSASSLMETAKKQGVNLNWDEIFQRLRQVQSKEEYSSGNPTWGMNYKRGMIQSGWLTDNDKEDSTIGKLASELGAKMWTYYNGLNTAPYKLGPDGGGLYWTTEDLSSGLTPEGTTGYSQQTVLSYRYNPSTGEYSVIENRAWVNQIGRDGERIERTHNALAQAPAEFGKPPANVLGTYGTYEEAQKKYNEVKAAHEGKYIYMGTTQTK